MKKLIYIILLFGIYSKAQISIGKPNVDGSSTILDFDQTSTNSKGIILPAVTNTTTVIPTNGTFLFDTQEKKIRMYENNSWKNLSETGDDSKIFMNSSEDIGNGVIIGSESSSAIGILVLESVDKAMILPKIENPHLTVKNPYVGMICYDTTSKSMAVFDGLNWNYWK
ncbi:hypothetical protein [Chishuiella sp.]|uniref:hypothetical protein n=1 Tax=Chishuiella sp. TaxID=1969467 RepID=UPI0028B15CA4|nr:hypothetical protein [Chishuiella sp.]